MTNGTSEKRNSISISISITYVNITGMMPYETCCPRMCRPAAQEWYNGVVPGEIRC